MTCRNCGAGLETENIDTSMRVATCGHCGSLHELPEGSFGEVTTSTQSERVPGVKLQRREVALPDKFKVQRNASSLEVTWAVGGLFHGVVLLVMAAGFAHAAVSSGMLFLLIASAGLVYFAAVRAINKHRIRVDGASLQVAQVPLPWPGTRKIGASDIEQLYATEHKTRSETSNHGANRSQVRKYYRLIANTRNKGRMTLLSGLHDPHQVLWLEQEIEQLLGIGDQQVAGAHVE